jgi:hypothetical protein
MTISKDQNGVEENKTRTIYIGNQPDPGDRIKITLTEAEAQKLPGRGQADARARVQDLSGTWHYLQSADCGSPGCRCALEYVPEEKENKALVRTSLPAPLWPQLKWSFLGGSTWTLLMGEEHYLGDVTRRAHRLGQPDRYEYHVVTRRTETHPQGCKHMFDTPEAALFYLCAMRFQEWMRQTGTGYPTELLEGHSVHVLTTSDIVTEAARETEDYHFDVEELTIKGSTI